MSRRFPRPYFGMKYEWSLPYGALPSCFKWPHLATALKFIVVTQAVKYRDAKQGLAADHPVAE